MITSSRKRMVVLGTLIAVVVGVCVVGVIKFRRAWAAARQENAYEGLSQMREALRQYEYEHGTLPPVCLKDALGVPTHSWRALMLQYLRHLSGIATQLNLSQPWNSDYNHGVIDSVPLKSWNWFARDDREMTLPVATHILAYLGRESIWEVRTGLPKGRTREHPDAIILISIPKSNLHPLQPGDITEQEVRERVRRGEEVLFIAAGDGHRYGIVTINRGELVFPNWQEVLDRREGRH